MPQILRPFQTEAIERLRDNIRRGIRSQILVSPTGSGKTTIAAEMIRSAMGKGKKVAFLAHRKELIDQCSMRLMGCEVEHGIIRATDKRMKPWADVHVASVPTLIRRDLTRYKWDLIFVDEAHRAAANSYQKILASFPEAFVVGLTATPSRQDGRGLGELFSAMVECPSVAELTEMGFLVKTRVFAPPGKVDLSKVHVRGGDYDEHELGEMMGSKLLIGDAVDHWVRLADNRITVAFAVSIRHSKELCEQFVSRGVAAEHLDGTMADDLRTSILGRWRNGVTRVVCSVGVLTEGYDLPEMACVSLNRPTMSVGLYLQMVGRGLRPAEGKEDCLILDHAGCTQTHGFVDDERDWTLDLDAESAKWNGKRRDRVKQARVCEVCWFYFEGSECPKCGWQTGELPEVAGGELVDFSGAPRKVRVLSTNPEYAALQREAEADHRPAGWVYRQWQLRKAARRMMAGQT